MKTKLTVLIIISILLTFSCGKEEITYTIDEIAGVKHVHNLAPAWGDKPKVRLDFVRKIGELESEDENFMFFSPRDIFVCSDGKLIFLDYSGYHFRIFDSELNHIRTVGRQGQGPGEFQGPFTLNISKDGQIIITDNISRRVIFHDLNGDYKRSFTSQEFPSYLRIIEPNRLLIPTLSLTDFRNNEFNLYGLYDFEGNLIKKFGEPKNYPHPDNFVNYQLIRDGNYAYFDIDNAGNIVAAYQTRNLIEKYSKDGDLLFSADRPLELEPGYELVTFEGSGREYPDFVYISEYVSIDHKNRIWVNTFIKDSEEAGEDYTENILEFEIFSDEGILLGKIPIPFVWKNSKRYVFRIFGDRLFIVEPYHEVCYFEYKIVDIN
ncbi:6-bladed beta-propeller [candidate division KSB1 bacterium]